MADFIAIKKDGKELDVKIKPRHKINDGWFMFFQGALKEIAKDREITGEMVRVLYYMLGSMGFENSIQLQQKSIGKELSMSPSHVSRAIKRLAEKKLIIKEQKIGKSYSYRLNSNIGWRGKTLNLYDRRLQDRQ